VLRGDGSTGDTYFRVVDAGSGIRDLVRNTGWTTTHRAMVVSPMALFQDGVSVGIANGAGSGVMTALPSTLYIGNLSIGGNYTLNGLVSRVVQCRRASGACQ
jgi:hypothetical protein